MTLDTFAQRLKHARVQRGLSQEKLANLNGISAAAIRGYEKGPGLPLLHRIPKMAETLNVSQEWLVNGVEAGPEHEVTDEELDLMPVENEYEFAIEEAKRVVAKRNGVPVEQVELLFQLRFPASPVGRDFPI